MGNEKNSDVIYLDMEGKLIPEKELTEAQIDDVLLTLMQKQIDEQVRSNKVIEGVLKDICNAVDRLSDKEL